MLIRHYNPKPTKLVDRMMLRTPDINQKVWEQLRRFENQDYVESLLLLPEHKSTRMSVAKLQDKREGITYAIRQAESYYEVANRAPIRIRPLLLYYGMLNLSKALILLGKNSYTLALDPSNKQLRSHGLSVGSRIPKDKRIRNGVNLLEEFCYPGDGVYSLLRQCYSTTPLPVSFRTDVRGLLSLVPEQWQIYQDYFQAQGLLPSVVKVRGYHYGDKPGDATTKITDTYQTLVFKDDKLLFMNKKASEKSSEQTLKRLFPALATDYTQLHDTMSYSSNTQSTSIDDHIVLSSTLTEGEFALIQSGSANLCDLDIHFMLMYILSNLVRYTPHKWSQLVDSSSVDELFLIEGFLEVSQTKFPNLILNELLGREVLITTPSGRW